MGLVIPRQVPTAAAASPVAFARGTRAFTLTDILAAADCLGAWEDFRARWRARERAAAAAAATGLAPEPRAIEEAVENFRYARDLVAGDECEAWLAARGLAYSDLVESVTRRLRAELVAGEAEDGEAEDGVAEADEARLETEALLADEFAHWARQLARRVAAAAEAGLEPDPELPVSEFWAGIEQAYREAEAALLTPEARQRELAARRLALMRLHLEVAEFHSAGAAREAWCCVREDGAELAAVAQENGLPVQVIEQFLGDLPEEWALRVQSARPGDVVLHQPADASWVAVAVKGRREPALDDPDVVARIDAALAERHFGELESKHIRWRIRVEVEG
jgi:hypothetical protein